MGGWVGVLPFFYGSKAMEFLAWLCPMSTACFSLRTNLGLSQIPILSHLPSLPFFPEAVPITIFAHHFTKAPRGDSSFPPSLSAGRSAGLSPLTDLHSTGLTGHFLYSE